MTPISHVSDTARWVAFYRAMETERPDAIFRDPYARRLAGEQGEAIVRSLPQGESMAWPMIVRTAVMDGIIMREVGAGTDMVVNLAAGLRNLARRALVVTEGLLIYLSAEAVAGLARDLHAQPAFARWLTDLASPDLLKMMEKNWAPVVRAGGAPFRFGPAENTRFFEPMGWREVEYRSTFDESFRLNRTMRFARVWRFIGRLMPKKRREAFARFSGMALLGRNDGLTD